jgi:hypothetical protein
MSTVHIKTKSAPPRRTISLQNHLSQYFHDAMPCAVQFQRVDSKDTEVFKVVRITDRCTGSHRLVPLTNPKGDTIRATYVTVYEDSIVPLHLAEVLVPLNKRQQVDRAVGDILRNL